MGNFVPLVRLPKQPDLASDQLRFSHQSNDILLTHFFFLLHAVTAIFQWLCLYYTMSSEVIAILDAGSQYGKVRLSFGDTCMCMAVPFVINVYNGTNCNMSIFFLSFFPACFYILLLRFYLCVGMCCIQLTGPDDDMPREQCHPHLQTWRS